MHRLLDVVDALPQRLHTTPTVVRALLTAVGDAVRAPLLDARAAGDEEVLLGMIRRGCGYEPDAACVVRLLTPERRAALDDRATAATGARPRHDRRGAAAAGADRAQLLDAGSPVRHGDCAQNAILDAFLGHGGPCAADVDMGEAVRLLAGSLTARR